MCKPHCRKNTRDWELHIPLTNQLLWKTHAPVSQKLQSSKTRDQESQNHVSTAIENNNKSTENMTGETMTGQLWNRTLKAVNDFRWFYLRTNTKWALLWGNSKLVHTLSCETSFRFNPLANRWSNTTPISHLIVKPLRNLSWMTESHELVRRTRRSASKLRKAMLIHLYATQDAFSNSQAIIFTILNMSCNVNVCDIRKWLTIVNCHFPMFADFSSAVLKPFTE